MAAADYTVPGFPAGQSATTTASPLTIVAPPPPPPGPALQALTQAPSPKPQVSEVTVQARRVLFVEGPGRGTKEITVGLTAKPGEGQPAHACVDQLWKTVQRKADDLLGGWQ